MVGAVHLEHSAQMGQEKVDSESRIHQRLHLELELGHFEQDLHLWSRNLFGSS